MIKRLRLFPQSLFLIYCLLLMGSMAQAGTAKTDRIAVEARIKNEISIDLAQPYAPLDALSGRKCLDGRTVNDLQGEIVELWANLECSYCGILEPVKAQRDNPDICIVVRHIPSLQYGESLKKAIAFEALRSFSTNAANRFWDAVIPKSSVGLPAPYEAALRSALEEAAIDNEAFGEALEKTASLVGEDIAAAGERIGTTPTYIIQGIRFPACDFKAGELPVAIGLVRKVRAGDAKALDDIAAIITRGLADETLL